MFRNEETLRTIYLENGASGSGASKDDRAPMQSASFGPIAEGEVVTDAILHIETTIAGATQVDVGNNSDAAGYISSILLTAGDVVGSGAVLNARQAAAGTVEFAVTGTATAGKAVIVLRGYRI